MSSNSEDLLKPEWIGTYNTELDALWSQAVQLNSCLYLLEKIARFPFNVFMFRGHLCWTLIAGTLYETCLMAIWRIAVDTGADVLTLRSFKNELMQNAQDGAKLLIADRIKSVDFDNRVVTVERSVRQLRRDWLAHLIREVASVAQAEGKGMPIIPVDRLKLVRDAINDLITALSFDAGRAFTYLPYSENVIHPIGTDPRSDIEKILDHLVESSPVFSMPEEQPDYWRHARKSFTEQELTRYNEYRTRLGRSPA
ncbi:MAG: hypothetical protein NTX17_07890 [Candidatus Eisenbacteria bacterium]|nr:hypothetical protein [Candidatus Eisenbacteria bacterium]